MIIKELLALGAEKIRGNGTYLEQFSREYEKAFNSKPGCTGCTFKNNYKKLYDHVFNNLINNNIMENHKINKRQRNVIHTYIAKNGKARRSFGKNMTDDFAKNYLSRGTKEELEARRKLFEVIPGADDKKVAGDAGMSFTELKKKYPEAEGNSKKKVLAWIGANVQPEAPKEEAKMDKAVKAVEAAAKSAAKADKVASDKVASDKVASDKVAADKASKDDLLD